MTKCYVLTIINLKINTMESVYKTIKDILEWKRVVENRSCIKCECINQLPKNATYEQFLQELEKHYLEQNMV